MVRRIGKFYLSVNDLDASWAPKFFSDLGFVPYRAKPSDGVDTHELTGTSKYFEEIAEGAEVPRYDVHVKVKIDPDTKESVVAIDRVAKS